MSIKFFIMVKINSLRLVSFNCKGFKDRNYDYLRELYNKFDIMILQETWLYSFQDNIIKKVLNGSDCYSISEMNPADIDRLGCPFSGCALVWK